MEFWSSREFAVILGYSDYRNFDGVIEKAKLSRFNSGHRIEDHFVEVTEMIEDRKRWAAISASDKERRVTDIALYEV